MSVSVMIVRGANRDVGGDRDVEDLLHGSVSRCRW